MIVYELLLELGLLVAHVDLASIGNATFPAPGDWQPTVSVALLLLAMLAGTVEELVCRGVIFRAVRASEPLAVAVVISSALFGLGHLSPDIAPANTATVFLDTFMAGSLAALAYQRTGSLYAPILARVFSDAGPALGTVLPHEMMGWVFLVTAELSVLGMLPFVFAVVRRQRPLGSAADAKILTNRGHQLWWFCANSDFVGLEQRSATTRRPAGGGE